MEAPRCGPLGNGDGGLLQLDCKSPVRFVGLASLIAVGAVFFSILWPLRWSLAALWLAIEALFFTFVWRPRWAMLDRQPRPHYPLSHDAMATFRRVLRYFSETSGIDTDMYYSGWFLGAKFEDIKRGALQRRNIRHDTVSIDDCFCREWIRRHGTHVRAAAHICT